MFHSTPERCTLGDRHLERKCVRHPEKGERHGERHRDRKREKERERDRETGRQGEDSEKGCKEEG